MSGYFLTQKMFQKPSSEVYNHELEIFLSNHYPQPNGSSNQRWTHLSALLSSHIAEADMIKLQQFVTSRQQVVAGRYNMSFDDFLGFMENFIFLLNTEHSQFKLSPGKKIKLLASIKEIYAGNFCEPGIVTRLNELILEYRGDTDWIISELTKQRYNLVKQLADEYNHKANVGDGYSVHTHMHMSRLAALENFGVVPEVMIHDAFLDVAPTHRMASYFQAHIYHKMKFYEQTFHQGLFSHLWDEFNQQCFQRLSKTDDGRVLFEDQFKEKKLIKSENSKIFEEFLYNFLGSEVDRSSFYQELDDSLVFQLVDQNQLKHAFKEAIFQKLNLEGFVLKPEQINVENVDEVKLICQHNASDDLIKKILVLDKNQIDFYQRFKQYMIQYHDIISDYPELFIYFIFDNVDNWDFLPKYLKNNTTFISALIEKLDPVYDERYAHLAHEIIKQSSEFFYYFSPEKQALIREHLGLMSVQELKDFYSQNKRDLRFGNNLVPPYVLAKNIKDIWNQSHISIQELIEHAPLLTPMELYARLIKHPDQVRGISLKALKRFHSVLYNRFRSVLYNLEHTYENKWQISGFLKFKAQFKDTQEPQQQPLVNTPSYDEQQVLRALKHHNNWLEALISFQQNLPLIDMPFDSINPFVNHLELMKQLAIHFANICGKLLKNVMYVISAGLIYFLSSFVDQGLYILSDFINLYIPAFILQSMMIIGVLHLATKLRQFSAASELEKIYIFLEALILFFCFLEPSITMIMVFYQVARWGIEFLALQMAKWMDYPLTREDITVYVGQAINYYLFSELNLYREILGFIVFTLKECLLQLPALVFTVVYSTIVRGIQTLCRPVPLPKDIEHAQQDIKDSISRLQFIDDISAQQKARVLGQIWNLIQDDSNESLQERLKKSYPITYQGKEYQVSFNQVAAIKRKTGVEFNLDSLHSGYSFFASTTSQVINRVHLGLQV